MPSRHAILSPSSSKRWMACPPSALAESKMPREDTSYSAEGTLAHSTAEVLLRYLLAGNHMQTLDMERVIAAVESPRLGDYITGETLAMLRELSLQATQLGLDYSEMLDYVGSYVDLVYGNYLEAKVQDPNAQLLVEAELNLATYIPDGFGSSDAVLMYDINGIGTLEVYDLKYGKGIKVDAQGNTQMLCYALGACLGPADCYCVDQVRMTIVQPRLGWVSTSQIRYEYLIAWAQEVLHPAALKAYKGEGHRHAGEHCQFCAVRPTCRAAAAFAQATKAVNALPDQLSPEELSELLDSLPGIKSWLSCVEDYALGLARSGGSIPGYKLVEGRSISKVSDAAGLYKALHRAGLSDSTIYKPQELRGLTELKSLLGSAKYKELVAPWLIKPAGKPTLVKDSDPRPAITDAASEFHDINL